MLLFYGGETEHRMVARLFKCVLLFLGAYMMGCPNSSGLALSEVKSFHRLYCVRTRRGGGPGWDVFPSVLNWMLYRCIYPTVCESRWHLYELMCTHQCVCWVYTPICVIESGNFVHVLGV